MLQKKMSLDIKEIKDTQKQILKELKKKIDCPLFDVKKTPYIVSVDKIILHLLTYKIFLFSKNKLTTALAGQIINSLTRKVPEGKVEVKEQ